MKSRFWFWLDFFSQLLELGQSPYPSLFLHQDMNIQQMGRAMLKPQRLGSLKGHVGTNGLRKAKGPRVQVTATTSSTMRLEVTTHGLIPLPYPKVLSSPQDQPQTGIPKIIRGTGTTTHQWGSPGGLPTSCPLTA